MKNVPLLVLLVTFLLISCTKECPKTNLKDALKELDAVLKRKNDYEIEKEDSLNILKSLLLKTNNPSNQYLLLDCLYGEYYFFNNDSASYYAKIKKQLAHDKNLIEYLVDSSLDWIEVQLISGMYNECIESLNQILPNEENKVQLAQYHYLFRSLYRNLAHVSFEEAQKKKYEQKSSEYFNERTKIIDTTSVDYLYLQVEKLQMQKKNDEAINLLLKQLSSSSQDKRHQAVVAYMIGRSYEKEDKKEKAAYYYALSSVNDVKSATHKHSAMHSLANLLFEMGDVTHAYRYINYAMADALSVNSRINIHYISRLIPTIQRTHDEMIQQSRMKLRLLVCCISLLTLCLFIISFIVCRDRKKIANAKRCLDDKNKELSNLNKELIQKNERIIESDYIKEAYIGHYMDLCSNYIQKIEDYKINLNNILRNKGMNEMIKILRNPSFLKVELDEFYKKFDTTFLEICPNFVEKFNLLLQEDKRITLKQGELLSTELRVFALIRLGMDDSLKIAFFLRRSSSTIYNYRVKFRNAAINNRDDFDIQIKKL